MLSRWILAIGVLGISLGAFVAVAGTTRGLAGDGSPIGGGATDFWVDRGDGNGLQPADSLDYVLTGLRRTHIPVAETYFSTNAPIGATSDAISRGVLDWNSVTPNFAYTLSTSAGLPASHLCSGYTGLPNGTDGVNSIVWAPFPAGAAIGVACWNSGTDECDIALDSNWAATQTSEAIRTVLLHEAGHCAGLGHSEVTEAVMYYAYYAPKVLTADDIAGICAIYGCGVTPTPTRTSTPTMTATPTATSTPKPKGCANNPHAFAHCKFLPEIARD